MTPIARIRAVALCLGVLSLVACSASGDVVPGGTDSPGPSPTGTATYSLQGGKAKPSFSGPGAAGICAPGAEVVEIVLERDVPSPRCAIVSGDQRLRVTSHLDDEVVATLGPLRITLPPGTTVVVAETFESYLEPGGHYLTTDRDDGAAYSVEIRFET